MSNSAEWWWGTLSIIWKAFIELQPLIGSLIALAAAVIAARPVWRQLEAMRVQTNSIIKDYLQNQIDIVAIRKKRYSAAVHELSSEVSRTIYFLSNGERIDPEWAFQCDQVAQKSIEGVQLLIEDRRDSAPVTEAAENLLRSLKTIRSTLDAIHRPFSSSQHEEEHSFSDTEWEAIEAASPAAEDKLPQDLGTLQNAAQALHERYELELTELRARAFAVNQAMLHATRKPHHN